MFVTNGHFLLWNGDERVVMPAFEEPEFELQTVKDSDLGSRFYYIVPSDARLHLLPGAKTFLCIKIGMNFTMILKLTMKPMPGLLVSIHT